MLELSKCSINFQATSATKNENSYTNKYNPKCMPVDLSMLDINIGIYKVFHATGDESEGKRDESTCSIRSTCNRSCCISQCHANSCKKPSDTSAVLRRSSAY